MLHPITIIIIRHLVLLALLLPQTAKISYSIGAGKKKTDNALHPDTFAVPVYSIFNINAVNSAGLDFSPVLYESKLVFISERELDYINYGESRFKKSSYLSVQYSNILNKDNTLNYTKPKGFSDQINQLNHNGPISFSKDGKYAVFTRTNYYKNNKDNIFRPRLYSAEKEDEKWKNIKLMAINKGDFSYAHPYLSPDGLQLFFTSDRDGGYGGKDLYMCEKRDTGWSAPLNLGHEINTEGDEVFPTISADKTLYFSSNGHGGLGGLDIFYSSKENGTWNPPVNIDSSINSVQDDFGLVFNEDKKSGYFSSNRAGGQGKDDIYGFTVKLTSVVEKKISIAGRFRYNTLPPKSADEIKIFIIDETGRIIQTALTDIDGYFAFHNLPYNHSYLIKTIFRETDLELELLNNMNQYVALKNNEEGTFLFRKITYKQFDELPFLFSIDVDEIGGELFKTFTGRLTGAGNENIPVYIANSKREVVDSARTGTDGYFIFKNLPYAEQHYIKTLRVLPGSELWVYNENIKIAELTQNNIGEFVYVKLIVTGLKELSLLKISDELTPLESDIDQYNLQWVQIPRDKYQLAGRFKFKSLPPKSADGIKVFLIDEKNEIIQIGITDLDGYFVFKNLPYGVNYRLKTEGEKNGIELEMLNKNNSFITFAPDSSGVFLYRKLSFKNFGELSFLYTVNYDVLNEDENLTKSFKGQLTGDQVSGRTVILFNEEGKAFAKATADNKGNFTFKDLPYLGNYHIALETTEPNTGMLVYINNNVVAKMAVNDKGEFVYIELNHKMLSGLNMLDTKSGNLILDDDFPGYESKWVTEINSTGSITGKFLYKSLPEKLSGEIKIILINEFGETIETAISDKEGYFSFNKLPYNRNYILKTEEYIPGLSLQLFDMNNNVKFTLVNDNSGKFLYKELSYKDLKSIDFLFVRDDTLNTVDATKSLTGRVIYKESPYNESANLHIYLINDEGEVIYSTVADKNGNFIFTNLPFASNYIIKTEKYNPDMDIVIFNHEKQVAQLAVNEKGEYVYLKLPQRATGDLALMEIDANYMITRGAEKMSPEEKYNEKIIFSDKTKTAFVFNTIQPKLNNDLSMIHGKPLGLCPESEGLAMEDLNDCIDLTIDELLSNEYSPVDNTKDHIGPENKTETGKGITFTLYFQFNSVELTPASKLDIEKVISALSNNPLYKLNINAHTDSQGEEEYNNLLSRKRAEVLKKAIAGQSIDGNQIISKEFGESQPAIVCTGKCSIAQHKLNRRAELIINY